MKKKTTKSRKTVGASRGSQMKVCDCCGNAPCSCPPSHGHKKQ